MNQKDLEENLIMNIKNGNLKETISLLKFFPKDYRIIYNPQLKKNTIIGVATKYGQIVILSELLKRRYYMYEMPLNNGSIPGMPKSDIQWIFEHNSLEKTIQIIKLLDEFGYDFDIIYESTNGNTTNALKDSIDLQKYEIFKLLLEMGANPYIKYKQFSAVVSLNDMAKNRHERYQNLLENAQKKYDLLHNSLLDSLLENLDI